MAGVRGLAIVAVAFSYVALVSVGAGSSQTRPSSPPRDGRTDGAVTGNIEHGRYLAEHVAMCVECHSGRDERGKIIPEQMYLGGSIPPAPSWSTDWALRAPRNKGLPGYSDEMALRLLTQGGIDREDRYLRPPMPRFRMTRQDAADIIAFLKSLP